MKFTPVTQATQQEEAFAALHAAFCFEPAALGMSSSGSLRHPQSELIWKWKIEPKSVGSNIRLWKNQFQRESNISIRFTVPLQVVDVNDMGLIATREDGRIFLCRQTRMTVNKVPRRSQAVFDMAWPGPTYEAFEVMGEPGNAHVLRLYTTESGTGGRSRGTQRADGRDPRQACDPRRGRGEEYDVEALQAEQGSISARRP